MDQRAIDHAIRVLNDALALDPKAISDLFRMEVLVNEALADHPTIQVGTTVVNVQANVAGIPGVDAELTVPVLRPLGLINGLLGVQPDSWGYIAMETAGPDRRRIVRFLRTPRQ